MQISSIYHITYRGKALGILLIVLAILIWVIGIPVVLFEIGFSLDYILSDFPLVERMMYLLIRVVLLFFPPFFILVGLWGIGKFRGLKEIVLESDRMVFRRKDRKEFALYEITEVKPVRVGLTIRGRTAAGKLVTRSVLRKLLGDEQFTMFKRDLQRLYGITV